MTPRQQEVLDTIGALRALRGRDPTVRELADRLGMKSETAAAHVRSLRKSAALSYRLDSDPSDEVLALVAVVEQIVALAREQQVSSRHLGNLLAAGMTGGSPRRWWRAVRHVLHLDVGDSMPDFRQLDFWAQQARRSA